jgi:hypothetical protein
LIHMDGFLIQSDQFSIRMDRLGCICEIWRTQSFAKWAQPTTIRPPVQCIDTSESPRKLSRFLRAFLDQ